MTQQGVSTSPPLDVPPFLLKRTWFYRLVDKGGGLLRGLGLRLGELDQEGLLAAAREATGLSDFGNPAFLEGLGKILEHLDARSMTFMRRIATRGMLLGRLCNRLRVRDLLKREPSILEVPVRRPIFVIGPARSGTTLLHQLLALDPAARALRAWELNQPFPPPEEATYATDPRREQLGEERKMLERLMTPEQLQFQQVIQASGIDEPEECWQLLTNSFSSIDPQGLTRMRGYVEWLFRQDRAWAYREHREQVQLLTWRCSREHLALKCPSHLWSIDAILAAYPDASLICIHRSPLEFLPSVCSLIASVRAQFNPSVDCRELGADQLADHRWMIEKATRDRARVNPSQLFDIRYADLMKDPTGWIRRAYEHLGYRYTGEYEARMNAWLKENRQHKHGVHRYALEDYGLTADQVSSELSDYIRTFGLAEQRQ